MAAPSTEVPKTHQLIKKEDVEKAIKRCKGEDAELESFEIKDFTTKGDNYASFVTSVCVSYNQNNEKLQESLIVKVNPCFAGFTAKLQQSIFEKEIEFYDGIRPFLNEILEKANEEKLKVPDYYFVRY